MIMPKIVKYVQFYSQPITKLVLSAGKQMEKTQPLNVDLYKLYFVCTSVSLFVWKQSEAAENFWIKSPQVIKQYNVNGQFLYLWVCEKVRKCHGSTN